MSRVSGENQTSEWFAATQDLVIDVPTAAKLLGISRSTGYEAVRRGEIPSLKLGRRVVVPVIKLRAMLGGSVTDDAFDTSQGTVTRIPSLRVCSRIVIPIPRIHKMLGFV